MDIEGASATTQPRIGPYTVLMGITLIDGGSFRYSQGVSIGQRSASVTNWDRGQFVAVGFEALRSQTSGQRNTAVGYAALQSLTTVEHCTAVGNQAARFQTGERNTAIGRDAMLGVDGTSTGAGNTAIGARALEALTTAISQTSIGAAAGAQVTTGQNSVFIGSDAGNFSAGSAANGMATGSGNVVVGRQAGSGSGPAVGNATAVGHQALVNTNALALGAGVSALGNGAVAIGRDNLGGAATAPTNNQFMLGTSNHRVTIPGRMNKTSRPPASAAAGGDVGDIEWDDSFFYVKTSTGWKRSALTTW